MFVGLVVMFVGFAVAADPAPVDGAAADIEAANAQYLEALAAWQAGDARTALARARDAQEAAGGVHEPAALLEGYALLRVGRRDDGMKVLQTLTESAQAPDVRRAASRTWHRYADRNSREHPSLFGGLQVAGRFSGEALAIGGGYTLGYDHPLAGVVGFAAEVSGYDTSAGTAVIEGPVLDILGSAHIPFGGSAWAARVKAGPSIWFSHGAVYGSDLVPNLGTRAVLGVDTRPWPVAGFFFDLGGWAWPGLAQDLPGFQFEWDARAGMVFWIRPPPG